MRPGPRCPAFRVKSTSPDHRLWEIIGANVRRNRSNANAGEPIPTDEGHICPQSQGGGRNGLHIGPSIYASTNHQSEDHRSDRDREQLLRPIHQGSSLLCWQLGLHHCFSKRLPETPKNARHLWGFDLIRLRVPRVVLMERATPTAGLVGPRVLRPPMPRLHHRCIFTRIEP